MLAPLAKALCVFWSELVTEVLELLFSELASTQAGYFLFKVLHGGEGSDRNLVNLKAGREDLVGAAEAALHHPLGKVLSNFPVLEKVSGRVVRILGSEIDPVFWPEQRYHEALSLRGSEQGAGFEPGQISLEGSDIHDVGSAMWAEGETLKCFCVGGIHGTRF